MLCGYKDGTLGDCLAPLGLVLVGTVSSYYWNLPRGKCALRPLFLCLALVSSHFMSGVVGESARPRRLCSDGQVGDCRP